MIQSVHIFKKDVRHLLPELGVYCVFLIVYSWAEPLTWQVGATAHAEARGWASLLLSLLRPLLPLLWLALISRLIHDESLVGDQQYWITRPYTRVPLAISKILFLLVSVVLPFAVMQAYLIAHAGLSVTGALPGMLQNLKTFGLVCWLPFMAIASVTSSLTKMLFAAISVFLGFFVFTLIVTLHVLYTHATPPFIDTIVSVLFLCILVATFFFQYITRRTQASRIILIVLFAGVGVLHSLAPSNLLFKHRYGGILKYLQFDPTERVSVGAGPHLRGAYGSYVLTIPLQGTGRAVGEDGNVTVYSGVAASYTVNARSLHYVSGWQPAAFNDRGVSVYIPFEIAERLGGTPADFRIDVVGEELRPATTLTIDGPETFDVPGNGRCSIKSSDTSVLLCRYAYSSTLYTVLRAVADGADPAKPAHSSVLRAAAESPCFDPIAQTQVQVPNDARVPVKLSVVGYQSAGKMHYAIDVKALNIPSHLAPDSE